MCTNGGSERGTTLADFTGTDMTWTVKVTRGVGDEVPCSGSLDAKAVQQAQVRAAWPRLHVSGLSADRFDEGERLVKRRRHLEDAPVRRQAQEGRPDQQRGAERFVAGKQRIEPRSDDVVLAVVATVRLVRR